MVHLSSGNYVDILRANESSKHIFFKSQERMCVLRRDYMEQSDLFFSILEQEEELIRLGICGEGDYHRFMEICGDNIPLNTGKKYVTSLIYGGMQSIKPEVVHTLERSLVESQEMSGEGRVRPGHILTAIAHQPTKEIGKALKKANLPYEEVFNRVKSYYESLQRP